MYIVLASSRLYSYRRQAITRDDDDDPAELTQADLTQGRVDPDSNEQMSSESVRVRTNIFKLTSIYCSSIKDFARVPLKSVKKCQEVTRSVMKCQEASRAFFFVFFTVFIVYLHFIKFN